MATQSLSQSAIGLLTGAFGSTTGTALANIATGVTGPGSPTLVNMLNSFVQNIHNVLQRGTAGGGTSTSSQDGSTFLITIDPNLVPGSGAPSALPSLTSLADVLAHELAHATQPGGYPVVSATPAQASANGTDSEGVAYVTEYNVGNELGLTSLPMPAGVVNTIKQVIEDVGANPAAEEAAVANYVGYNVSPSSAPGLTYNQSYADQWVLQVAKVPYNSVDWLAMNPAALSVTTNTDGSWSAIGTVPSAGSFGLNEQKINISGLRSTSITGPSSPVATGTIEGDDSSGSELFLQTFTTFENGTSEIAISGSGADAAASNAAINLGDAANASINGGGNTIADGTYSHLTLSGSSNKVTMGEDGYVDSMAGNYNTITAGAYAALNSISGNGTILNLSS